MMMLARLICAAMAVLMVGPASAQESEPTPIVEKNPGGVGVSLVNRSKTTRFVATLRTVPQPTWYMKDKDGQSVLLQEDVRPVLLQPGQSISLPEWLVYEDFAGAPGQPPWQNKVLFDHSVLGAYVPSPDLAELPRGKPEDMIRFYEVRSKSFPAVPTCVPKYGTEMWGYAIHNFDVVHTISVTFRLKITGFNKEWQTVYLRPGQEAPAGCVNDWANDIEVKEIRFAS